MEEKRKSKKALIIGIIIIVIIVIGLLIIGLNWDKITNKNVEEIEETPNAVEIVNESEKIEELDIDSELVTKLYDYIPQYNTNKSQKMHINHLKL